MSEDVEDMTDVEDAFSEALGHIRNATEALMGAEDPSRQSLLLGMAGLDLQAKFAGVWPVWIPNERTPAESLACAEEVLGEVLDHVPLGLWTGRWVLRERVSAGVC